MYSNGLENLIQQAGPKVTHAIRQASARTGVDFSYLMNQAKAESSFQTDIKAKTSSATGLYQFIDKTWLSMVRDHGHKHGLGKFVQAIDENSKVSDPALKQEILNLRKDPKIASVMAAEFASSNHTYLEKNTNLGSDDIGKTELYFAHFLGAGKAAAFLEANQETPMARAADLFPREARANHNVFYDSKTGEARTIAGVYEFFDKKFGGGGSLSNTAPAQRSPNAYSLQPQEYYRPLAQKTEEAAISSAMHSEALSMLLQINNKLKYGVLSNIAFEASQPQSLGLLQSLTANPVETMILGRMNEAQDEETRFRDDKDSIVQNL